MPRHGPSWHISVKIKINTWPLFLQCDSVPHQSLLQKLCKCGIWGPWLTNFLMKQKIIWDLWSMGPHQAKPCWLRHLPNTVLISHTTPLPIDAIMWFRDNLPDRVKSTVHLIADDCILYHKINSFQNYLQLQEDLKPDRPEPLTGVWL